LNSGTISEISGNIATASSSDMTEVAVRHPQPGERVGAARSTNTHSAVDKPATTRLFHMKRRIGCVVNAIW
jgi:hypothetical protein